VDSKILHLICSLITTIFGEIKIAKVHTLYAVITKTTTRVFLHPPQGS